MPEIFDAVKWAAMIQQTGGGTGFSFSRLRPSGDRGRVDAGRGLGAGLVHRGVQHRDRRDPPGRRAARRQHGHPARRPPRRPRVHHAPRATRARLRNFNVSVAITDEFMRAVDDGRDYALRNPRSGAEVRRLDARQVWQLIAQLAWKSGEPGVIFIDRINARESDAGARRDGVDQPVRRAAAAAVRGVQPGVDRRRQARRRRRGFDWARLGERVGARRALPRRRHRRQPLSAAADRGDHARQPQDRPRRHGLRRRAHPPGHRLRLGARRSRVAERARRASSRSERAGGVGGAGARARAVRQLAGLALADARARRRCATRPPRPSRRPARSASSPAARAASSRSTRSPSCARCSTASGWSTCIRCSSSGARARAAGTRTTLMERVAERGSVRGLDERAGRGAAAVRDRLRRRARVAPARCRRRFSGTSTTRCRRRSTSRATATVDEVEARLSAGVRARAARA